MRPLSAHEYEDAIDLCSVEGEARLVLMAELLRLRALRRAVADCRTLPRGVALARDAAPPATHRDAWRAAIAAGRGAHDRDALGAPGLFTPATTP